MDRIPSTGIPELDALNASVLGIRTTLDQALPEVGKAGFIPASLQQIGDAQQVIDSLTERARFYADYRRSFEEEWHRSVLAMFQILYTEHESSWQSQRYMPLVLANVETALSVILSTVLDSDKLARLISRTPDGQDAAKNHEALLEWQTKGPCKTDREIAACEWWSLVTGTGIMDTGWVERIEDRMVPVVRETNGVKRKELEPQRVTVADNPLTKAMNPLDVYLCPHSGYGKDHEDVFIRVRVPLGDIRRVAGKGHINKEAFERWVEDCAPTDGGPRLGQSSWDHILGPHLWDTWLEEIGRDHPADQPGDSHDKMLDGKLVEVLVYRSRSEIVTMGDDKHVIGYSKNPHIHRQVGIVTRPFLPVYGCPYGRGLAGLLLGHQELLNANVNLFHDVSMISSMRPIVVDRALTSSLDDEFVLEPSSIIRARMNAKDAVVPLDIPAPTNLFLMWDQHLRKDADDTSGFTEQARGISPANSPTATEFSGVQANIQNRLKIHVKRLRWFVEDVVSLMVQLNQQYYTVAQMVALNGDQGMTYSLVEPWQIVGEVQIVPTTSPRYANQDLHVQRMIQLLQVIMPAMTGQMPLTPPLVRFLREILRASNIENADQLIPMSMTEIKDPDAENVGMQNGIPAKVSLGEIQNPQMNMHHMARHAMWLQQMMQDPNVDPNVIAMGQAHLTEHQQMGMQMGLPGGIAGIGAPPPGIPNQQQGGSPVRSQATALGTSAGGGGTPGVSSPGPAAPPGRSPSKE